MAMLPRARVARAAGLALLPRAAAGPVARPGWRPLARNFCAAVSATTPVPEVPTRLGIYEGPSLKGAEEEARDYANKGAILCFLGGHGIVWQLAADLPPLAAIAVLCTMTGQLVLATNSASVILAAALSRSVTRVDLILPEDAQTEAAEGEADVDRALAADEVRLHVINDMMWHDLRLARPSSAEDAKPPFRKYCELGICNIGGGKQLVPAAVEWLKSTEYVIKEETLGWLREPPNKALKLPSWADVDQATLDKLDAAQQRFGQKMTDATGEAAVVRIGHVLAGAGTVWIFVFTFVSAFATPA